MGSGRVVPDQDISMSLQKRGRRWTRASQLEGRGRGGGAVAGMALCVHSSLPPAQLPPRGSVPGLVLVLCSERVINAWLLPSWFFRV